MGESILLFSLFFGLNNEQFNPSSIYFEKIGQIIDKSICLKIEKENSLQKCYFDDKKLIYNNNYYYFDENNQNKILSIVFNESFKNEISGKEVFDQIIKRNKKLNKLLNENDHKFTFESIDREGNKHRDMSFKYRDKTISIIYFKNINI